MTTRRYPRVLLQSGRSKNGRGGCLGVIGYLGQRRAGINGYLGLEARGTVGVNGY
jgi:hypothetical protein